MPCAPEDADELAIVIPGPAGYVQLPVVHGSATRKGKGWSWNGSVDAPTLRPSINTTGTADDGEEFVSHIWLNDGVCKFLGDCTHGMAGKELPLEEVESILGD